MRRILSLVAGVSSLFQVQCSKGVPPRADAPTSTGSAPIASSAASPPLLCDPVVAWAGSEAVAIVQKGDTVVARALDSGRTRLLREKGAKWVLLDGPLDLLWVQGATTLDVLDLRASSCDPIPIASGLPEGVAVEIDRTAGAKRSQLGVPDVCTRDQDLFLDWTDAPGLRFISPDKEQQAKALGRAKVVGAGWLREQLLRSAGAASISRRAFSTAPLGPIPVQSLSCAETDLCGHAIPFGPSGRLLVVTDYSEGDCRHYGCRVYDPASKKVATPPREKTLGDLPGTPPGPCGLYRYDRSSERFLLGDTVCTAGGKCEDLGGTSVGWLSGGTDVGTDG